jgi:phage baseplate assembly protein W
MNVAFPMHLDARGRMAEARLDAHVHHLVEQVLFTSPGERVNRPDFGSGLLQLVFAGNSEALAAATQLAVQASLQEWLGDLVVVEGVAVTSVDATLDVRVQYVIRRTQSRQTAVFQRPL